MLTFASPSLWWWVGCVASVDVPGTVLNAHPACEPAPSDDDEGEGGGKCYVAYGCGYNPSSSHACISTLATSQGQ